MDGDEGESDMGLDSRGDRRSLRAVKACRGRKCREEPGSCYIDDGETTSCRVKSSRCTNQSCHILDAIFQKIIKSLEVKLLLCSSKKERLAQLESKGHCVFADEAFISIINLCFPRHS